MTAISLFTVFVLAKAVSIASPASLSVWWPFAYLWQDALVAAGFGVLGIALRGPFRRILPPVYSILSAYTAINIPVLRAVATPLTLPMLRAAGGPLADSLRLYLTATNLLLMALTLATAWVFPHILRRAPPVLLKAAAIFAIPVILLGPLAVSKTDTRGLERSFALALIRTRLPTVQEAVQPSAWRTPQYDDAAPEDLSRFSKSARNFNVVMIGLESTAAQYLALYGAEQESTPNLSHLAHDSLVFDNAYAVYPESIKGLYSILCSAYPVFDSQPEQYANSGCNSIASVLSGGGYRTAMFHSGRFGYLGMESIIRNRGFQTLEDAGNIGGNYNSSFGVDEPATVARILNWLDSLPRDQRFFVTYLPIAGHHPYATPGISPVPAKTEIDQYRNALRYGDASLGTLIEGLRARGLDRNTVWIVYGDHGEAFHQHPGNYGHTFFLYEENVHVPLLIASASLIQGEQRVRKVVSLIDIAPTLLDLLGIAPHGGYQGSTVLDSTPRMALFLADYSLGLLGLRDGSRKFITETGSQKSQLFDLDNDRAEMFSLSARSPEMVSSYRRILRGWSNFAKINPTPRRDLN